MFGLRHIDRDKHALEITCKNWKASGEDAEMLIPEINTKWLPVADEHGKWSGWVSLREIFQLIDHKLAGMAIMPDAERLISEWVQLTEKPLKLNLPELEYQHLCAGQVFDGVLTHSHSMIKLWTGELNLWVERVATCRYDSFAIINRSQLSWPVNFIIGVSKTTVGLINQIRLKDILLITSRKAYVSIYNRDICELTYSEELMMYDSYENDKDIETNDYGDDVEINSIDNLPVKVEFVLESKVFTLREVEALCESKIISVTPENEKNIEIRINGVTAGHGELVEIDNKLGVIINSWLSGSKNVE
ncbi:YscQ/HrcQ family type III secretion apparatus protein [Escherichia albertii]|uniref:YscQ/HrcQ family type III secretion apparatus protein n=1 Tax=Escherichia albertii TaxID=208962 RepID=UPI00211A6F4C|nr:YscQ/HrcQ family type III secretion apparatus protein [Escherichia albertii]MCQ8906873.1 YscQ/HrcQ family type III secretion apparatus protein [Escherichia albertii]MCQ8955512.1 YscQ/HrcQ family type III secretion apparatus protein [Escherichia albertii]MCQ8987141.1 YscQ/HrcQ family type III secretion apparatus protein [Escherichia albertii]UUL30106.1 YscQ/HrcQ family type III secretion apparatus protein [Escherichia albertii]UUL46795.1 YscQ/HrcQ family type III secretion apparatus protein 